MEKIKEGETLTIEGKYGVTKEQLVYSIIVFVLFIWALFISDNSKENFEPNIFLRYWFLIVCIIISLFAGLIFYVAIFVNPWQDVISYKIYFFKNYLLLENFDKTLNNYELDYCFIERIYSSEEDFITIDVTEEFKVFEFKLSGLKKMKLIKKYRKNSEDIIDYLNSYVENYKKSLRMEEDVNMKILEERLLKINKSK